MEDLRKRKIELITNLKTKTDIDYCEQLTAIMMWFEVEKSKILE